MAEETQIEEYVEMEGEVFEIHGMQYSFALTLEKRKRDRQYVKVDGQLCRCIGWLPEEEKFAVQTFDEGITVAVPKENLRKHAVPPVEDGGFDLVWGGDDANEDFGEMVALCLARKGYCVVQMFTSPAVRREAAEQAFDYPDLTGNLRDEIKSAYLGFADTTRMIHLGGDEGTSEVEEGDAIGALKRQFSNLWMGLAPSTMGYLGFETAAWTGVCARPSDGEEEGSAVTVPMDGEESQVIASYDHFLTGRKVCALYMLDNGGGEVRLCPRQGALPQQAGEDICVPVKTNRLLLFRHDLVSYAYMPEGKSTALQAWLMSQGDDVATQRSIVSKLTGAPIAPPRGANAQIMSHYMHMPGGVEDGDMYWAMMASGGDMCVQWPAMRWDTEPYYTEEDNWAMIFKAYTKHGSYCTQDHLEQLDHKFFGMTEEQARVVAPGQRMCLEVGYTCLVKGGHTRASLNGENMGVYLGDVGMDWHAHAGWWSEAFFGTTDNITLNEGIHVGYTAQRLSHIFNLIGPVLSVDTACSASLVSLQAGHHAMLHHDKDAHLHGRLTAQPHSILAGGVNTLLNVASYIGNCAAGMLSHIGRCFTYDKTADGYQRGEGMGQMFIKWSSDELDIEERMAVLVGSCANHDGRSASLTAPNGPSQQDCERRSMKMANMEPKHVTICECHGTGTALGDPIEIGALQAVMRGRTVPLFKASAKTHISHLEGGAGIAGILKCLEMALASVAPPNAHLRSLNPNLESISTDGYPCWIETEPTDTGISTCYCGVSSFGFGGTNSRADLYARAIRGFRGTGNIWTEARIAAREEAYKYGLRCTFKGALENESGAEINICMVGSWSAYAETQLMQLLAPGVYTSTITLGDTRWEQFQLLVNGSPDRQLYPAADSASSTAPILGPDEFSRSRQWLINGVDDCMPSGTTYRVMLEWKGKTKSISWKVEEAPDKDSRPHRHRYYLVDMSRRYKEMHCVSEQDNSFETTLEIEDLHGGAQFHIMRDKDLEQLIYPAIANATDVNIPVRGPEKPAGDDRSVNKWFIPGEFGERIKVGLQIWNGKAIVTATSADDVKVWHSYAEPIYYISGTFNNWKLVALSQDRAIQGLYRYHLTLGESKREEFMIKMDRDGSGNLVTLTPNAAAAVAEEEEEDQRGIIEAEAGSSWEILLDLHQDDRTKMMYWRRSTGREQHLVPYG